MTAIKGNHPYADAFPMASEDELNELAASISVVGLIHPVVLTPDGLVLDGRNRLAACEKVEVEPTFEVREGDDDDYKEFVIGANTTGRRESMTVQIAAAAAALILGHEKRKNGRWSRQSSAIRGSSNISDGERLALTQAGLVLDVLGPAHLLEVRDGGTTLNAAYDEARREKERIENAERRKQELIDREHEEEEAAKHFFDTNNAAGVWVADRLKQFDSMAVARAAYERVDREARLKREEEEREAEEERQRLKAEDKRVAMRLQSFTEAYSTAIDFHAHDRREQVLSCLEKPIRDEYLALEKHIKDWSLP